MLVCLCREVAIGELTIRLRTGESEIGMAVDQRHRGHGIGTVLLETAATWAKSQGVAALGLRVFPDNEAALRLYRRMGFIEVAYERGAIQRRDGTFRDVVVMRRLL